jgi:IS5 family transposase
MTDADGRDMLDALVEGQTLLADRAYDSDELRRSLDERGAWANIKSMPNRKHAEYAHTRPRCRRSCYPGSSRRSSNANTYHGGNIRSGRRRRYRR